MDPSEERLKQVLDTFGVDLWSLIDTAIAVATRDHPGDLRLRREGIVQSLYALTPCRNCDQRPELANDDFGADSTRINYLDESAETFPNGSGPGVNPGHRLEASPEMRAASPTLSPEAHESPEHELEDAEQDHDNKEISLKGLMAIKDFLEDSDQKSDVESLVCLLQNLVDMEVTKEALIQTGLPRLLTSLRKTHKNEEVRQLTKPIISKWKEVVWNSAPARDSSSSPVPTEEASPQRIPARNHRQNSNGPHELMRSPKRQNGAFCAERSGSDFVHFKAGSSSRSEAPARPNNHHRSATPSAAPPAKRKEKEDGLSDQARLDSARKRLQENYQEAQNAKKQRTVQVMSLNEIPKPKNAFIRKGGSTSKNR